MKSLREYIIVAGKDLKEELNHKFLLNHKLNKQIQNKKSNIKFASSNVKLNFDYPVLKKLNNNQEYEYELIGNKTLKIPKAKFFVFKDNYRNKLHICSIEDMIGLFSCNYDDYDFEDFNSKYIVAAFDDIKDAVMFAIEDMGYEGDFGNSEEIEDWLENQRGKRKKYYDSIDFMIQALNGEVTNDDYDFDPMPILTYVEDVSNVKK